ncbi:hypothetical protein SAMN06265338_106215 [Rhodoblastus acidophilus]|uniref:J domain-containing protein n=2 Tax=Rhodoblastus acidophilus TaxID=1074 RepID=A0A212RRW9_RHOAC|nr:hypothetical protein CKO16_10035 [Rhodoblastus acidophilus]RAI16429.1 hypothetical protein CH337_21400 [Rhodoblastus acidophilus]SNB75328.1 hypothetical protein SAMN06265338_106215 [Rhodoblastus acidophilus]
MLARSAFSYPEDDFATILDALAPSRKEAFFHRVAGVERLWLDVGPANCRQTEIEGRYAEQQTALRLAQAGIPTFEEIAARIAAARSAAELHRLRRTLALAAHPDRVAAEIRADAERLMARVNAAIDEAARSLTS